MKHSFHEKLQIGVMERWSTADWLPVFPLPITPLLQYSILRLSKRDAAVDIDGLAGDEVAQRRRQKQHGADDILGHLNTLQRTTADGCVAETKHLLGWIFF